MDSASDLLIKTVYDELFGKVLDVGCGYGVIGITVATNHKVERVKMLDVNHRALALAKKNAEKNQVDSKVEIIESDGFESISDEEKFDAIVTNPPIRAGKSVIYQMYEDSQKHLNEGGSLYLVINKKHGAPSTITFLNNLFGNCEILNKKSGFHVLKCTR